MIKHYWYQFKKRVLPYPFAFIGKYGMKAILLTCKVQVNGLEQFIEIASRENCILMVWHNRMAMIAEFFCKFAPHLSFAGFISKSRDGEPISRLVESYQGGSSIRVSHHLRHKALQTMIARLKLGKEVIVITPDGPRGPRYKVKPGIIMAAKEAEANVIPFTWEAERYWEMKTWDGFRLPKPFSTITISLGNPVKVGREQSDEDAARLLESMMDIKIKYS